MSPDPDWVPCWKYQNKLNVLVCQLSSMDTHTGSSGHSSDDDDVATIMEHNKRLLLAAAARRHDHTSRPPCSRSDNGDQDSGSDDSSSVSLSEIEPLFGHVEYCGYEDMSESVAGETFEDVLQNLIDNMKSTGISLSVSTAAELVSWLEKDGRHKNYIHQALKRDFISVIQKIGPTASKQGFFRKLLTTVVNQRRQNQIEGKGLDSGILAFMEELAAFHVRAGTKKLPFKNLNRVHTVWRNVIQQIILNNFGHSLMMTDPYVATTMGYNEDRTYKVDIHAGTKMGPTAGDANNDSNNDDARKDAATKNRERASKPPNTFTVKPDIVLRATIRPLQDLQLTLPLLDIEIKTTLMDTKRAFIYPTGLTPSDTTSSCERLEDSSGKGSDTDFRTRFAKIRTQHFLQLLGAIRSSDAGTVYKTFGSYIVMNRIYLTHLGPFSMTDKNLLTDCKQNFPKLESSKEYHDANADSNFNVAFKMSISKYLDLFKESHFLAFIAMIQFIVWHEFKADVHGIGFEG